MSEILLAKPNLPPGFIDVSVGEPHVVREALLETFDLDLAYHPFETEARMYEYPPPTGYQPLVEILEAKHRAPVIITNGAKQALGASFYALKKMGKRSVGMRNPYWALIPPLAKMHDLNPIFNIEGAEAVLSLLPNNPDGFCGDPIGLIDHCNKNHKPLIHDAAYYTHVYMPRSRELKQFGDIQIYSISKMLGLSGLRIGYVVCPNPEFYRYIQEYMEAMTVGVSVLPQMFLNKLFRTMELYPKATAQFEVISANALQASKQIMSHVDPEVLVLPTNVLVNPGMFGWYKVGPKCDFTKAKINVIDGALFGEPGMVRMNLAFDVATMSEIVDRLNLSKKD